MLKAHHGSVKLGPDIMAGFLASDYCRCLYSHQLGAPARERLSSGVVTPKVEAHGAFTAQAMSAARRV